jgi:hypothetical protein
MESDQFRYHPVSIQGISPLEEIVGPFGILWETRKNRAFVELLDGTLVV